MQATKRDELCLVVPMDACNLADLRWRSWSYLAAAEVASGMIEDILIALHEAVANALTHSGSNTPVAVRMKATRRAVVIEVADQGRGIDPGVAIPPGRRVCRPKVAGDSS
jgi:anti-sigma regulatory factor (Ser/Thr protein kinase)